MSDSLLTPMIGGGVWCAVSLAVWRMIGPLALLRVRRVAAAAVAVSVATGLVFGLPVVVAVGPMVAAFAAVEAERRLRRARDRRRSTELPVVVDGMVQQLRSGMGLRSVCAEPVSAASEVSEVLRPLGAALRCGGSLREAVGSLQAEAIRREWLDVQLFAATLAALADRGGPAVPALQRLRLTLMGSVEARSRARIQAGQAQASATVLAGAPALFALVVALADPDVGRFYLREPLGAGCVAVALALSFGGWQWMNREVDRAIDSGGGSRPGAWWRR